MRLPFPLLAISDRYTVPEGDLNPWLRSLAAHGVAACQLREKDLDDRELFERAVAARRDFPHPNTLWINGRADLALAARADGVHLPADALSPAAIRERFGDRLGIGVSTHSIEEVERATEEGADYATFGPIFATPSKAAFGSPLGLEALARAAKIGLPLLALGGITSERFEELASAGARGAAGIRLFSDPAQLQATAEAARRVFRERPLEEAPS